MKMRALLVLSIGLYAFSCESEPPLSNIDPERQSDASATVIYAGDPTVDGCGWLIQQGQTFYSPVNLASDYKTDSLKIVLSYKVLESTWNCGWRASGNKHIEVLKIEKQ